MDKDLFPKGMGFLKKQLLKESSLVGNDSIAVLGEFEIFEEEFYAEESGEKDHGGNGHE